MISERRPVCFSNWDVLSACSLSALLLVYYRIFPFLPESVPTHFNKAWIANCWTPKAALHWIIFGVPLGTWTVLFVTGVAASALCSNPSKARVASMQPARGFMMLGTSIIMGACLLIPFFGLKILFGSIAVFFICLGLAIFFTIREANILLSHLPEASRYR